MATDNEMLEAFAKNGEYILKLEAEIEELLKTLEFLYPLIPSEYQHLITAQIGKNRSK